MTSETNPNKKLEQNTKESSLVVKKPIQLQVVNNGRKRGNTQIKYWFETQSTMWVKELMLKNWFKQMTNRKKYKFSTTQWNDITKETYDLARLFQAFCKDAPIIEKGKNKGVRDYEADFIQAIQEIQLRDLLDNDGFKRAQLFINELLSPYAQQQPKQYKPTLKPTKKEATKLPFQSFKKNKSGCLHLCKQAFFRSEN